MASKLSVEGEIMPRYVIERDIPDIGSAERAALRDAAHKSNSVLAEMKAEKKKDPHPPPTPQGRGGKLEA